MYFDLNGKLFTLRCLVAWSEPADRINVYNFYLTFFLFRLHKTRASGLPSDYIFYGGPEYLWVVSMELASYHHTGAKNFAMAPRFFGKFVHP